MSAAIGETNCPKWCTNHDTRTGTHESAVLASTEHGAQITVGEWRDESGEANVHASMWTPGGDASFDTADEMRQTAAALLVAADRLGEIEGRR